LPDREIAVCYSYRSMAEPIGETHEAIANATLYAAAPDLLKTLEEIAEGKGRVAEDRLTHAQNTIENMKALANAALAKAKGA
jgi:hypothetical protein